MKIIEVFGWVDTRCFQGSTSHVTLISQFPQPQADLYSGTSFWLRQPPSLRLDSSLGCLSSELSCVGEAVLIARLTL